MRRAPWVPDDIRQADRRRRRRSGRKIVTVFSSELHRAPRPPIAPSNRAAPPVGERRLGNPRAVSWRPSNCSSAGGPSHLRSVLDAPGGAGAHTRASSTFGERDPNEGIRRWKPNQPTLGHETARGSDAVGASRLRLPPSKSADRATQQLPFPIPAIKTALIEGNACSRPVSGPPSTPDQRSTPGPTRSQASLAARVTQAI
jgi:hypothetical protein